ncbi:MAG: methyltransferase domain-containing protein [Thermomicrobiales bacterium]|nr:methyltransferase domain-containing protein [Thermomicrobiales bacterium]MCO5226516.1 methyltransferase domain-containing protein [Thermomicrobiales bacterium]MCO5227173.1 methyltransferase domain-containing protein [Thermomicrobiales bacterium]
MTRVILGAGTTTQEGWISTQESELDLLNPDDFARMFAPESVDAFLAEHVWEHMTADEGRIAARTCYRYLKPGGYIRVAVPDANFRNDAYQQIVQIGGPDPVDHPAASHKIVYDYRTLLSVFKEAGYEVAFLEYCDDQGNFHYRYWNPDDGHIGRSYRFDTRNSSEKLGMVSIIIDAFKPQVISQTQNART